MIASEITLSETINNIDVFSPIKVTFNDIVLYNDYDYDYGDYDDGEIIDKVYGEVLHPLVVIPDRIKGFERKRGSQSTKSLASWSRTY